MKILQIINSLDTGGAEKLLLDSIHKYKRHGIVADLLVLNGTKFPFLREIENRSNCNIYALSKRSIYNPWLIFKLRGYINRYDVVHVHLFPSLYWVALSKFIFLSKTPLIFTEHNTTNKRRDFFLFKLFDRFIYKRYERIVTISEAVHSNLLSHLKCKPVKLKLISNGIDLELYKNASPYNLTEFGISPDERIIIQVASFTKQKDQKTLIKAISILNTKAQLLLVGEGPTLKECRDLVREIGLEEKIHFLGIRIDVPNLLSRSDVVVLSSHYEGLSLSSIEGMASGKAFVASNVPGLKELVEGSGVLVPENDSISLANELDKLFNDEGHYTAIVGKCQQRVTEYSIDTMVTKYIELYREIWGSQS